MANRLTIHHPLTQKMKKLEQFMHENKISIDFDGYHLAVTDQETNVRAFYRDIDGGSEQQEFPGFSECKLVVED